MAKKQKKVSKAEMREAKDMADKLALSDKAHHKQYASMFRKLRKMIRLKEEQCLSEDAKNGDYYVLNTLYSQMRETIADIRTIVDMSGQANEMIQNVIVPLSTDTLQLQTDLYYQLKLLISENSRPKRTEYALKRLDGLMLESGKALQHYSDRSRQRVFEILVGTSGSSKRKKAK